MRPEWLGNLPEVNRQQSRVVWLWRSRSPSAHSAFPLAAATGAPREGLGRGRPLMNYGAHTAADFFLQNDSCLVLSFLLSSFLAQIEPGQMIWGQDAWLLSFLALGFLQPGSRPAL